MANITLTDEMKQAIDSYSKEIKTLEDYVTAVRKIPGMYIGPIGNAGFLNMIREIYQNSIDQIIDPQSPADNIYLSYNMQTLEVVVQDNGKGMPFDSLVRILTEPHTSKNYEKKPGQYSSGRHGQGCKVVNALSLTLIGESYRYDGKAVRLVTKKGYPTTKNPVDIPNKEKRQGSRIYFIPDTDVMGDISLEWKTVYTLVKHIVSLTPIGSTIVFEAVDMHGKKFTETIVNKDGIITDLIMKVKKPIIKPITMFADDGFRKLECAFCYDAGDENGPSDEPSVTSFSNYCPTQSGTHIDGTIDGISKWFVSYMNNIYLNGPKNKLKVTSADIKCGLNIMISAAHIEPNFTGQAKEILSNEDMIGFCKEVAYNSIDQWSKSNPQDLSRMARFLKDIAEVRTKAETSKAKIVTKYQASAITGLPAKYVRPTKKPGPDTELIIVEGDSALGTVEEGRNPETQGLFPIRGKIINAFGCKRETFFANAEVQAITRIVLGSDYKKGFKVEDCQVGKVIFMSDADVDGAHISALLLRMFIMYFPQMIEAGMVYKAIPPLYQIKQGNKKRYFTEQIDIVRYIQKIFLQNNDMKTLKKATLENKDVTVFFLKNADYIYHLERIASTYAVQPYLLEMVLNHYTTNKNSINLSKLQKELKSVYRFMTAEKVKDTIIIKGTIDKSNLIIFNDKFLNDCKNIIKIIKDNEQLYYLINGEVKSLYQIMKIYDSTMPNNVQRYKGLGEMDADELAESALYPGSDRTLVRYTLQDAKEEIEAIREYESNTKKILTLVDNVTRDDLLD